MWIAEHRCKAAVRSILNTLGLRRRDLIDAIRLQQRKCHWVQHVTIKRIIRLSEFVCPYNSDLININWELLLFETVNSSGYQIKNCWLRIWVGIFSLKKWYWSKIGKIRWATILSFCIKENGGTFFLKTCCFCFLLEFM